MVLIAILLASLAEAAVSFVGALVVILHPAAMKAFAHRVLAFAGARRRKPQHSGSYVRIFSEDVSRSWALLDGN